MTEQEIYDLCIVGAGYAGLNAAFVASRYLPSTARVLVLDKHEQPGGMWNDAYSYVRLHQPYQMFTAGNIPWTIGRERAYLASRDEVAAHLRHCFEVISKSFEVDARWGWECVERTEEGGMVVVSARAPDGQIHRFRTSRFIEATGFDVETMDPLPLASHHVHSIAPAELASSGLLSNGHDDPVWVIGSGKTAMDTVVALVRSNPSRPIGMVAGTGTFFFNRDRVTPTGLKRWIGGTLYSAIFAGAAERFDGTNSEQVAEWCRDHYGTWPMMEPAPTHLLLAFLSEDEAATVAAGVGDVVRDHLIDVVDGESGPVIELRTGARHPILAGSWIVNCTGYLRPKDQEHNPFVSPSGRVMSVNLTSTTFGSTGISAYFLTHLFFLEKLADAPFYELDMSALARNAPGSLLPVWASLIQYNISVLLERIPMRVFTEFKLDFDGWYPQVRRLPALVRMMRTHKRDRPHHRQTLDTFSQYADVRCGPLSPSVPSASSSPFSGGNLGPS
jgi:hypothetical protein